MELDILMDEVEQQRARFICFMSENHRYDFWVFYSEKFYGKSIVYSMQSGKLIILCSSDLDDYTIWRGSLGVAEEDANSVYDYLKGILESSNVLNPQY